MTNEDMSAVLRLIKERDETRAQLRTTGEALGEALNRCAAFAAANTDLNTEVERLREDTHRLQWVCGASLQEIEELMAYTVAADIHEMRIFIDIKLAAQEPQP